jgi:ABC-type multidrug transport system fused ATPase/permease subunit
LVRHPAILILDEATSHLDVVNEQRIERHLATLAATRIVIAHRLSTIRNADLILVLEDGQIVEHGTHETLIVQNGVYGSLVNRQSPLVATTVCDEA